MYFGTSILLSVSCPLRFSLQGTRNRIVLVKLCMFDLKIVSRTVRCLPSSILGLMDLFVQIILFTKYRRKYALNNIYTYITYRVMYTKKKENAYNDEIAKFSVE